MTAKEKIQRSAANVALDKIFKYIDKNPTENMVKLIDLIIGLFGENIFPKSAFEAFRAGAANPDNVWNKLSLSILKDCDRNYIKKMLLAIGLGAAYNGTKAVRANREVYGCNIPFIILLDPTSACNLKCKGCWSAEYGHKQNLSYDELESIVSQGVAMGTHFYMYTGGEPLIRKNDIIKIAENHPDCAFLIYTNATLIDKALCDEVKRVGNITFAVSVEGSREVNDSRRGEGAYDTTIKALDLLKENRCFFGISVCYTSENIESVTSDEFMTLMIEKGVKFGMYFNYMPVGSGAVEALIPRPEQREYMYNWLRKTRNSKTGNPMFIMDFQNDAEYVGGCIAGGRNYFHINSAGDIEPCVFIHYSDSNIRTHTLIEALKNPLFQAYWHGQPFNDNHLRPCPMLENPDLLREIINKTGAKSTDLIVPESVDTLCSRCDKYAKAWKPEAERIWNSRMHPNPKTQFYRDTPEGKAEAELKNRKKAASE